MCRADFPGSRARWGARPFLADIRAPLWLVNRRSVPGLVLGGHLAELFVDLADAFSGFCELRGLGE